MKKNLLIWILLFWVLSGAFANPVDKNTAKKLAKNFYSERMTEGAFPGILSAQLITFKGLSSYYAINIKHQKGFVLVAANNASLPVLGYSFQGEYGTNNQPQNFAKTLEQYNLQLEYLQKNKIKATPYIKEQWKKYLKPINTKGSSSQTIGPLLTTVWAQGCYYNDSTPVDQTGLCGHPVVGCVATAMAQVMNYYEFPTNGSASHSYNSNYGTIGANFGATTYNWNNMPDTLNSQSSTAKVAAVAQLMSHCGIAVEMMYSTGGSGAYSQDAANAFAHYYNYDMGLQLLHRANYVDSIWEQMVRTELDSMRPIYYDGSGTGGHAFVCDGYQNDHYFHFNWGWSGSNNGYFLLSALNPGGMNFSNYCGAVFGMKPGITQSCNGLTDTLTAKAGNIADGSYGQDYQNNINCSWLINPLGAVNISLEFFAFDLLNGDSVFIYDGLNSNAIRIGAYSGNNLPTSIASSGGQMFIQFMSNNQNTASGWSAYYRSEYCDGLKVLSNSSGTITDGSGVENYNDYTNCYWLITDSMNNAIHLDFTNFQTEQSFDYVDVYDGGTTTSQQLGSFSGNQIPPSLTSTGGMMLIHFHSDGGVTDQGWEANYYVCSQPIAPNVSDTASFCTGDSVMLIIPNSVDSFIWFENGIAKTNILSKQWAVSHAGNYSYTSYSNVCPTISSPIVVVLENQIPQLDLGCDTILCDNLSILLSADSGFVSYLWSNGDTTQSILVNSSTGNNQTISLTVTDSNTCSNSDLLLVQFVDCTALKESSDIPFTFKIFPNPVDSHIQLEFSNPMEYFVISIFDGQGHTVFNKEVSNIKTLQINSTKLASGMYYLEVKNGINHIRKKFIKK